MNEYSVMPYTPGEYDNPVQIAVKMENLLNTYLDGDELVNVLERDGTFYFIHRKVEPKPKHEVKSRNR